MDSRIREIEQWVVEAREGLSEGGREAYLRKLYLLEAEIRAVIKENGMLPQGVSPLPVEKRVRRNASPAWAFSTTVALAGFCVLAATTFYFVRTGDTGPNSYQTVQPRLASVSRPATPDSNPPTRMSRLAAIMADQGEELLPDNWPPATEASSVGGADKTLLASAKPNKTSTPAAVAAGHPAGTVRSTVILASAAAKPAKAAAKPGKQAAAKAPAGEYEATDVVMLASAPAAGSPVYVPKLRSGKGGSGSMPSTDFNDVPQLALYDQFPGEGMAPPIRMRNTTKTIMQNSLIHGKENKEHKAPDVVVDTDSGDDGVDSSASEAGSAAKAEKAVDKSGGSKSQTKKQSGGKS